MRQGRLRARESMGEGKETGMQFEKIQNNGPKVPELVMDSLLKAMEAGTIRVGEELPPERDLAEALGISRNSLRECLAIMNFMGKD